MPKQIKLTDSVADTLSQRAAEDNLSLAGEVAKLLTIKTQYTPEHTQSLEALSGAVSSLEKLIDTRFDELKSLIEDHLVDVLASSSISGSKQAPGVPKFLKWGNVQYIMFELLEDDGAPEWIVSESMLDRIKNDTYLDSATFTVKDDVVYINDSPLIRVTPRVREAIDEERVCE